MKVITPDNYLIRPFRVNKTWVITHTFLSASNPSQVFVDLASTAPQNWNTFDPNTSPQNLSGIYRETLYQSISNIFYETGSVGESSSVRFNRSPVNKGFQPTGSNFYVVNVPQQVFGERINPGSFVITAGNSTASIVDDGSGRLVSTITSAVVGNIFYSLGIAVVGQYTGSYSGSLVTDGGLYLTTGSQISIQFEGAHTIYEHQVICTIDPGEFNFSVNPTVTSTALSGSMSASVFVPSTGSTVANAMFSGSLTPYFTTVGLYNDVFQLVAIAKVPRAIHRIPTTQQTVIVRFDA